MARNGRLQVLRGGLTAAPEWREVPRPDPDAFGLPAGTSEVRFSTAHPPAVLPSADPSKTLVFVADQSGPFWSGELSWNDPSPKPQVTWSLIEPPDLSAAKPGSAPYIVLAADAERQLLVADGRTVWRRRLSAIGQPLTSWINLGTLPGPVRRLVPVRQLGGTAPIGMVVQLDDTAGSLLLVPALGALNNPVRLGAASTQVEIDAIQTSEDQQVAAAGPEGRTVQFWSRGSSSELRSLLVQVSPGDADTSVPVLGTLIDGSRIALADGLGGVPGPHVVFLQSVGGVTTLRAWRVGSTWIADVGRHPRAAGPLAGPVHVADDTGDGAVGDDSSKSDHAAAQAERIVIADDNQRLRVIDPNVVSDPVSLT